MDAVRKLAMIVLMYVMVSTCVLSISMLTPLRGVERQHGMRAAGVYGVQRWSVICLLPS